MHDKFWVGLVLVFSLASFGCAGSAGSGNASDPPSVPVAGLSPASLAFGSEQTGATSAAQTVTLSNTGNTSLSITSVATSGDFQETNICPASLAAAASCTIQVSFAPTASGTRTGSLTVQDNDASSSQSVSLTGTGTSSTSATTAVFYVAPDGNDSWSGKLAAPNANGTDGPFATFDHARAVVRSLDKTGLGQVVVEFRAGTYVLPSTEQFTAADSGTPTTQIIYENYPGETPVISGGVQIKGWTPSATIPGAWQASVAGLKPFEQLWVNGHRRDRVRVQAGSSSGYFYNLGPIYVSNSTGCTNANYPSGYSPSLEITSGSHAGQYECFDRFFFKTGDINPAWSGLSNPNHPIEIIDFEDWTISRMRLESIGSSADYAGAPANSSVAYLVGATARGKFWGFLPGHRYLIDNVKDALSSSTPGEWYLHEDASGNPTVLTYVPAAGEDFSSSSPPVVIAPQLDQLVVSDDPNGFSYVTFKGLTFSYANWVAGSPGATSYNDNEDAGNDEVPAALSFSYASHVTLDSDIVAHVGGWGAEFIGTSPAFVAPSAPCSSQAMKDCNDAIVNSEFTDLGSGAIRIGAQPRSADTNANVAQYNLVYNTVIAGGDRMMPGVGIAIGNSHDNEVDHNDIYDLYNTGINVGDSLNFDGGGLPNFAHDNRITYNDVHQLGQGVTSDMGCVYTATALQTGNLIEHNVCHNIANDPGTGGYGGWGIYLDQGSSFVTVMDNLVYNTTSASFHYNCSNSGTYLPNGTPNLIQNNIFAFGARGTIQRTGDDGVLNFTLRNNIFYWDQTAPGSSPPSPQVGTWTCNGGSNFTSCFDFQRNLYYSTADPSMTTWRFLAANPNLLSYTLPEWQALGEDLNSVVNKDPLFVCPGSTACSSSGPYNFSLQSDSPAPQLIGFQPFDPSKAGRAHPVLMPASLPPAFPLQLPASY